MYISLLKLKKKYKIKNHWFLEGLKPFFLYFIHNYKYLAKI